MIGPARAAKLFERYFEPSFPPTTIRDILTRIIAGEGWGSDDLASEMAEKWLNAFRQKVVEEIERSQDLGPTLVFKFSPDLEDHLEGVSHCRPGDSERLVEEKTNRGNLLFVYEVLKDLGWSQLEVVCRELLRYFGVSQPHTGRGSADQGIDFFGHAEFGTALNPILIEAGFERQLKVWFVGQAKHYPDGKISTTQLRELIGTLAAARSKIFAESVSGRGTNPYIPKALAALDLKICDPVFAMLVTTGVFTRDSRNLLRKCGIIAIDGKQLGQFLADRGIGIHHGRFNQPLFEAWLQQAIKAEDQS